MYFGTQGLSLGNKFKVENDGSATASDLTLTGGSLKIGDNFIVDINGNLTATGAALTGDITTIDEEGDWTATFGAGYTFYSSKKSKSNIEINFSEIRLYSGKNEDHCSISFYDKDIDLKGFIDDGGIYRGGSTSMLDWKGNANLNSIDLNYSIYNSDKNSLSVYISGTGSNIASLGNGSGAVRFASDAVQPSETNTMTLGSSNYKWSDIFAATGSINNSDRNAKDNIKSLTDVHEQFFMKLLPVSFTFKDGTSGRTHIGFISQDVESAMEELGMTSLDFAGFCKDIKTKPCVGRDGEEPDLDEDGNVQYIYSLRYGEFVALNSYMIQKLYQRVIDLENKSKQ
jgi:hypothetical protein